MTNFPTNPKQPSLSNGFAFFKESVFPKKEKSD